MAARRALAEGESFEQASPALYRSGRAARGLTTEEGTPVISMSRVARRRLVDDTTTIRPGWRSLVAPITAMTIHTNHVTVAPKHSRAGLFGVLVPVTLAVGLVGFGFLTPSDQDTPPVPYAVAVPAVATASNGTGDAESALDPAANGSAALSPADQAAADAMSTDATVKAQASVAAQAAADAGTQAKADADAKAAQAKSNSGSSRVDYGTDDRVGAAVAVPDGAFIAPVSGYVLTSPFGWRIHPIYHVEEFHSGNDLAVACGTPIHASGDGVVTYAGWNSGGLGNYVEINHGTFSTGYGHQSKVNVTVGQKVKQGDIIGYVGSTGTSTGCHVHFQAINSQGQYFDSLTLIH